MVYIQNVFSNKQAKVGLFFYFNCFRANSHWLWARMWKKQRRGARIVNHFPHFAWGVASEATNHLLLYVNLLPKLSERDYQKETVSNVHLPSDHHDTFENVRIGGRPHQLATRKSPPNLFTPAELFADQRRCNHTGTQQSIERLRRKLPAKVGTARNVPNQAKTVVLQASMVYQNVWIVLSNIQIQNWCSWND